MVSAIEQRCCGDGRVVVVETHLVRTVSELEQCDALILPGGWSNLQSSIFDATGLGSAIQRFDASQKPRRVRRYDSILAGPGKDCASRRLLGIANVTIENNTVNGEHFVIDSHKGKPFKPSFSNGPIELGATIERLASLEDGNAAVVIRDDNVLISACHSGEVLHSTFLKMCQRKWSKS